MSITDALLVACLTAVLSGMSFMYGKHIGRQTAEPQCAAGWIVAKRDGQKLTCWHKLESNRRITQRRST